MFRIKICGITTPGDAVLATQAGADAIGLNFYPNSPRFLPPDRAMEVAQAVPAGITKVGVFVNATAPEVCAAFDQLGLGFVQLHGDEPPEFMLSLGGRPTIRVFRIGDRGLLPAQQYLARCRELGVLPRAILLDALVKGAYGGTGRVADWATVRQYPSDFPPLVLAGGLTCENVAEAIRSVRPAAVDTASGVESSPGRKDEALMRRFVLAAREAFAEGDGVMGSGVMR